MRGMAQLALVALAAGAFAGCQESVQQQQDDAITLACRCLEFLPSEQDTCVTQLEEQASNIQPDCLACIEADGADCPKLLEVCIPLCEMAQQQPVTNIVKEVSQ